MTHVNTGACAPCQRSVPYTSTPGLEGLAFVGALAAGQVAYAGEFDARGRLDTSAAALSFGFDAPPVDDVLRVLQGATGTDVDFTDFIEDPEGLEGSGALEMGGERSRVLLPLGESWDAFQGRRIEVTLWYKPQGTDLRVAIDWVSGDGLGFIQGAGESPYVNMGLITFHPTGRATSDGWIELSSGAFDYAMGTKAPEWITLTDTQHLGFSQFQGQQYPYDRDVSVLVDALEVVDLGESAVPNVTCSGADEVQLCGAQGLCLLGQCVDSSALGHAPSGDIGRDYLERRLFEMQAFAGPREGRQSIPEIRRRLEPLDPLDDLTYWQGFSKAHELLIDGHGAPPSDSSVFFYHPSGVCFGPGLADLSSEESRRTQMLPMVFSANADFDAGALLQRGDVLTHIDGQDTWTWVDEHPELFYYNGDPRARQAILTQKIMQAAKQKGSTLSFERCTRTDGVPCTEQERVEVDIDFAQLIGEPLWNDAPPADIYRYTNDCDMRFEREVSVPVNTASYYFAGWKDVGDDIRHLIINGVPGAQDRQGANWHTAVDGALAQGPDKVVLDQRTGYGGTMEGVARVVGHLLDPSNRATTVFVPWVGEEVQGALLDTFFECSDLAGGGGQACGNFSRIAITDVLGLGGSRTSKVAVLNGFDVSGNDYLSRFLAYREAPTRIFGYGPAFGAYGQSCSFTKLLWENQPMRYQCHDSLFAAADEGAFEGYESGTGVAPDEVVYQRQSDALAGEDTMIKAAHEWLQEPGEVTP